MGPQTTKVYGPQGKKLEFQWWLLWPPPLEWPRLPPVLACELVWPLPLLGAD